jgi:hypothetical protein
MTLPSDVSQKTKYILDQSEELMYVHIAPSFSAVAAWVADSVCKRGPRVRQTGQPPS